MVHDVLTESCTPEEVTAAMEQLLSGGFRLWVGGFVEDGFFKTNIIALTTIGKDVCDKELLLILYALKIIGRVETTALERVYSVLRAYGRERSCSRVVGYTDSRLLLKEASALGARVRAYVELPL